MPFLAISSWYHSVLLSHAFQPRTSAAAAAFMKASCVGLSSESNAALLTKVTFFGIQARVS